MRATDINAKLTWLRLREVLDYNPETGLFYWRKDGSLAGWEENTGYIRIKIDGRTYQAHRLAWLYVNGAWPKNRLDHRDCNQSNNKYENLREATDFENSRNKRVGSNNFLGIKGVRLHESGKYQARIYVNGKFKSLGLFVTAEEAKATRDGVILSLHGEFARSE